MNSYLTTRRQHGPRLTTAPPDPFAHYVALRRRLRHNVNWLLTRGENMAAKNPSCESVLALLREANGQIDAIAAREGAGHGVPKIVRADNGKPYRAHRPCNGITHHVRALAGYLRRTAARSIRADADGIIVEVRRVR
jgi:hypothetical protein